MTASLRNARMTESQAARIERRIELLRADDRHAEATKLQCEYWDACNLSLEVRAQLEARSEVVMTATRASYRKAIRWIADNDDTSDINTGINPVGTVTMALVADLFGKTDAQVRHDILRQLAKAAS